MNDDEVEVEVEPLSDVELIKQYLAQNDSDIAIQLIHIKYDIRKVLLAVAGLWVTVVITLVRLLVQ